MGDDGIAVGARGLKKLTTELAENGATMRGRG
jgi:hypothetical protein